jgi:hypothetical protein
VVVRVSGAPEERRTAVRPVAAFGVAARPLGWEGGAAARKDTCANSIELIVIFD